MKEIETNKQAWALLAKDHYLHFKEAFANGIYSVNRHIAAELGDIKGKKILHLQCNTGADSIWLAQAGADVTGVDLVPENIFFARQLAAELNVNNIRFIESDIMTLRENHHEQYDIIFTSEGAVIWLPDLTQWAQTIDHLLRRDGFFYLFDAHPFYLMFDEAAFANGSLQVKYPYFNRSADLEHSIGGYAAEPRPADNYSWMYSIGGIVSALAEAGLTICWLHEFDGYMESQGFLKQADDGLFYNEFTKGRLPMMFSIKAVSQKAGTAKMIDDLLSSQDDIARQMEKMRAQGKTNTVKFKELLAKKLTNNHVLILLEYYGLK